jgi:hypothetical protein
MSMQEDRDSPPAEGMIPMEYNYAAIEERYKRVNKSNL